MTIKKIISEVDNILNKVQPNTMDALIDTVHSVEGIGNYGTHFTIVVYKGYIQGVRVYITGNKISHVLPSNKKVYSVFKGIGKYINAGYQIEEETD